jgi:hypothetical protein
MAFEYTEVKGNVYAIDLAAIGKAQHLMGNSLSHFPVTPAVFAAGSFRANDGANRFLRLIAHGNIQLLRARCSAKTEGHRRRARGSVRNGNVELVQSRQTRDQT